ncbi:hypothetical protein [Herpetosiphon gulosus]|uniref:Uncharacterized protein n=1 Tax=Herpetosiphon gulosus TaxID=1973496 RepID=A0ABP9WZ14_9CHLR
MNHQSIPQTASELGLMQGFPPASSVEHTQQLLKPYNRWSFQHIQLLNPVADVWHGTEPSSRFEYDLHDLDSISYKNYLGQELSFNHMVEQSYTDGLMVLHRGKVIYERYLNGMQPHIGLRGANRSLARWQRYWSLNKCLILRQRLPTICRNSPIVDLAMQPSAKC